MILAVGRHFASAEILTFIAAFVHLADAEIVPGRDTLKQDKTRVGLGIFNPKGTIVARMSQRILTV